VNKTTLAPYSMFGKTKMVPVRVYVDAIFVDSTPEWDEELWVERGEDWYAVACMKGKRVRVVTREDWIRAKEA